MPSKIDVILSSVGALSKYQWSQLWMVALGPVLTSLQFMAIVFHSIIPDHRCKIPVWGNDSYSPFSQLHNQSIYDWIPVNDDGQLDSCRIYSNNNGSVNNVTSDYCEEYVFDKSKYWGVTLNERFGMICEEIWAGTTVKIVFSCGQLFGAVIVGAISDRFGRKIAFIGCLVIGGAVGVVAMFSVNYYMFAALRFIIAMCFIGVALVGHIIMMEIIGPESRTQGNTFRGLFWPAGVFLISLIAYYVQDWNWFQLALSVPSIIAGFLMMIFLKETPHFLVTKGRHEEAEALFKHMAKMNGRTLPDNFMDELKEDEQSAVTEKLKVILKAPVLIKRTLIFCYLWFIAGLGYYGLGYNVSNLTGDIYINNVISGAADLPVGFFVLLSLKTGRKPPTIFCLLLGSVALLTTAFMTAYLDTSKYNYAMIAISMVGKLGIATVFIFDYFWCSEMFPTTLRSTLVGLCSLFARIGSILSPIIVDLNLHVQTVFGTSLGALIFGITMLIGGVLAFFLPETNKQRIPETIAEANVFMTKRERRTEEDKDDSVEKFNMTSTADLIAEKKI